MPVPAVCGLIAAVFVLGPPAAAAAQSLAEIAEKEKKRRAKVEGEARTFTNSDLEGAEGTSAAPAVAGRAPASEAIGGDDADERGAQKREWRTRAAEAREAVARTTRRIADIEARIQELATDINPTSADLLDPNRLQRRDAERRRLIEELESQREELAEAQAEVDELEEDARREGVPAGWVREP